MEGITLGGYPVVIFLFGSTIDSSIIARLWPERTWSRSGPVVPPAWAALKVWQPLQPLLAKTWAPGPPGTVGGAAPGTPAHLAT